MAQTSSAREAPDDQDGLLTPSEVAKRFGVHPKTVSRWAAAGKLRNIRTLGGHRRFRTSEVLEFLHRIEDHGGHEEPG